MQDVITESGEYGKALEALYVLMQNSAIDNEQLITYYDKLIQYLAAKGLVPIQTSLKGTAKDFYIYYTKQPQHVVTEDGQRKTYCGKSFSVSGFLSDFDILSMLRNNWNIIRRTQYQTPKYYSDLTNYSNSGFCNLHVQRGPDAEKIPQQLYFAGPLGKFTARKEQDGRQKVAFQLMSQLQKYLIGGVYQARLNIEFQQNIHQFTIKYNGLLQRKHKTLMYKIPQHIQEFGAQIGKQQKVTPDIGIQYYDIIKQNYMGEFLRYLHDNNYKANLKSIHIKDELCGIRADLSRSDEIFKMRLIKHLYVKIYGIDFRIKNAGSLSDLYQLLGAQKAEILQKQAQIFINKQLNQDCGHYQLVHNIFRLESQARYSRIYDIIKNWQKPPQQGQSQQESIQIKLQDESVTIPADFIVCQQCDQEIICAHKCIQYLLYDDFEQASKLQQIFKINDVKVSRSYSFCYVCGELLSERDHFSIHNADQQLDPDKKYSMYRTLFKNVLSFNITTSQIFNIHQLFKDMVTTIQPMVKKELTGRKGDIDYKEQKLQVLFIFVCAYFVSISGEQFQFSSKDFYQKNKKIIDNYDKFLEKVAKIQGLIKPLFVLNNISAVQSLIYRLQHHPMISHYFENCDVVQKLQQLQKDDNIDLRQLYFNESKLQNLHSSKLDQLSGKQINEMLLAHIVKYSDVYSQAIHDYSARKKAFAQTVTHRFHQPNECQPSRYMPFKGRSIGDVLSVNNQSTWLQSLKIFYKTKCPEALKKNQSSHIFMDKQKICKLCGIVDTKELSDEYIKKYATIFKQQYHTYYGKQSVKKQLKISEQDSFEIKYDELTLIKIAMRLELQPIQLINLCGFDHVDYQKAVNQESMTKSTKTNQKEKQNQAQSHQTLQKNILSKIIEQYISKDVTPQKYENGNNLQIKEIEFINTIQFCWSAFRSRLDRLHEAFVFFISKLGFRGENMTVLQQINRFHKKYVQSHKNHFALCQVYISQFFSQFIPYLAQHNQKDTMDKLLKELIERDKRLNINPYEGALALTSSTTKKQTEEEMDRTIDELFGEQDIPEDFYSNEEEESEGDDDIDVDLMDRADNDDGDDNED